MLYQTIRILLVAILLTILLVIFRKKVFPINSLKTIILVAFGVAIFYASSFFPFENLFISFPSAEAAYKYVHTEPINKVVYGDESTLIFYQEGRSEKATIPYKTKDGWKLTPKNDNSFKVLSKPEYKTIGDVQNANNKLCSVSIYMPNSGNEYYVIVSKMELNTSTVGISELKDSLNSKFTKISNIRSDSIESEYEGYEQFYEVEYYTIIPKNTSTYSVSVDGQPYEFDLD